MAYKPTKILFFDQACKIFKIYLLLQIFSNDDTVSSTKFTKSNAFLAFLGGKSNISFKRFVYLRWVVKIHFSNTLFFPNCNCITVIWTASTFFLTQTDNGIAASYFSKSLGSSVISPHFQRMMIQKLHGTALAEKAAGTSFPACGFPWL